MQVPVSVACAGAVMRESRVLAGLCHDNIVRHYDTFVHADGDQRYACIAMERLLGTLAGAIGALGVDAARQAVHQIAAGLAYLHGRGVYHGDLKPENAGVSADNKYKLIDFGSAAFALATASASGSSRRGAAGGGGAATARYASPARLSDGAPPSPEDDLWALGWTIVELATGSRLTIPLTGVASDAAVARYTAAAAAFDPLLGRIASQLLLRDGPGRMTARAVADATAPFGRCGEPAVLLRRALAAAEAAADDAGAARDMLAAAARR